MKLTQSDIQTEYQYILEERLGIMCGAAEPTPEQYAIAESEADAWVDKALSMQKEWESQNPVSSDEPA